MLLFTQVRGGTVWKSEMGPEVGPRMSLKVVEGVLIGPLLPPNMRGRVAVDYFPNSFGR